jgi:hypothetical protein
VATSLTTLYCRHCGDNGSKKNELSIDSWLDATTPASTWVLLGDVKLKFGEPKIDHRLLHYWHRLDLSNDRIFGTVFVHEEKWARAQLRGGASSRNIPEPGTLALLSIGLLGAALSCRYKQS